MTCEECVNNYELGRKDEKFIQEEKINKEIKYLESVVEERSASNNYQGWCAESIRLDALKELIEK